MQKNCISSGSRCCNGALLNQRSHADYFHWHLELYDLFLNIDFIVYVHSSTVTVFRVKTWIILRNSSFDNSFRKDTTEGE